MFSFFRKTSIPNAAGAPLLTDIVVSYGTNNKLAAPPTKKQLIVDINQCIKLLETAKKAEEFDRAIRKFLLISGMVVSAGSAVVAGYYLIPGIILSAKVNFFEPGEDPNHFWWDVKDDGDDGSYLMCSYRIGQGVWRGKFPTDCLPDLEFYPRECKKNYDTFCDLMHNYDDWKKQNPYTYPVGIPGLITSCISFGASSVWKYFDSKNKRKEEVIKIMKRNDFELLKQIVNDLKIAQVNLATDKVDDLLQKFGNIKSERIDNINRMYAFCLGSKDPNSIVHTFFATQGKVDVRKHIFDYVCGDESWQTKISPRL